jgi:hypothetical protein
MMEHGKKYALSKDVMSIKKTGQYENENVRLDFSKGMLYVSNFYAPFPKYSQFIALELQIDKAKMGTVTVQFGMGATTYINWIRRGRYA